MLIKTLIRCSVNVHRVFANWLSDAASYVSHADGNQAACWLSVEPFNKLGLKLPLGGPKIQPLEASMQNYLPKAHVLGSIHSSRIEN